MVLLYVTVERVRLVLGVCQPVFSLEASILFSSVSLSGSF